MLKLKCISGGQTGSDQAGLHAAKMYGISTGGYAPKGWLIQTYEGENISYPELTQFDLLECHVPGYPPRTRMNAKLSDLTVWFGYDKSRGGKLTIDTCKQVGTKVLINPTTRKFVEELTDLQRTKPYESSSPIVINIAGNRFSKDNPHIYRSTMKTLIEVFNVLGIEPSGWLPTEEMLVLNRG